MRPSLSLGLKGGPNDFLPRFDACRGGPRVAEYPRLRGKALCLWACVLDDVVDTGEVPSEVTRSSLEPFMNFTLRCPRTYLNGQHRVEVLWRTLTLNTGYKQGKSYYPATKECGASFRSWLAFNTYIGIRNAVSGGAKRSDCFGRMRNLVELAMSDPTGVIT